MKEMLGKYPVIEYENNVAKDPLVSVIVASYNHEKYIERCLDGILGQKTEFPYEIILGEDSSEDNTRNICMSYADQYKNKIRLFLHDRKNVIYIEGKPSGRYNFMYGLKQTRGKYIALCEGDDFWTCEYKLQKQIDFLRSNEDFTMCCHNVMVVDEKGNEQGVFKQDKELHNISLERLLMGNCIMTCSVAFRNDTVINYPQWIYEAGMGDWPLFVLLAQSGKIKHMPEVMASHRHHVSSVWWGSSTLSRLKRTYLTNSFFLQHFKQQRYLNIIIINRAWIIFRMGMTSMWSTLRLIVNLVFNWKR